MQKVEIASAQDSASVEQFYAVHEVAEMLGLAPRRLLDKINRGDFGGGVKVYRWVDIKYARMSLPLSAVNVLRKARNLEPLENVIEDKDRYERRDLGRITGLTWRRIYQLTDMLVEEANFYKVDNWSIGIGELRRKFGELAVEEAGIYEHDVPVEEAARKLGWNEAYLWAWIESGRITAFIPVNAPVKYMVDKDDLLKWIESKVYSVSPGETWRAS